MTESVAATTPRYAPGRPFPPYAYVTRQFPHPTRDAAGHGVLRHEHSAAPDPARWHDCEPYLYGIDLFNHGYYWEAHEAWESLWHACGRRGITADFLRALIHLTAAGFKVREGRPNGVTIHADAARQLFERVAMQLGGTAPYHLGLALRELIGFAAAAASGRQIRPAPPGVRVAVVFAFSLCPDDIDR